MSKNFDLAIVYLALSYAAYSKGLRLQKCLLKLEGVLVGHVQEPDDRLRRR